MKIHPVDRTLLLRWFTPSSAFWLACLCLSGCQFAGDARVRQGLLRPNEGAIEKKSDTEMVIRGQNDLLPPPTSQGTLPPPTQQPAFAPYTPNPQPYAPQASPNTGQTANPPAPNGTQPYAGQPVTGQPYPTQPYPTQPYAGQPVTGQPYPTQPYAGQPVTGQPYPTQPYAGQPVTGQPYVTNPAPGGYVGSPGQPIEAVPGVNPYTNSIFGPAEPFGPPIREVPVDIFVQEARTGRFMIGGAVNSDAGVTGQITLDERNFDITRYPRSFSDILSGRAWRGAGQSFRLEAVPGNRFQRYMVSFGEPYIFGYLPISFNINGFLYNRRFRDYDEERVGGRFAFGYRVTPDLTLEVGLRGEQVDFQDPRVIGIPEVDKLVGDHDLYGSQVRLTYDTRDIAFAPTQGHLLSLEYEQIFGSFDFPRFNARFQHFELIRQRPDGSGRHTLSFSYDLGISGKDTPIFENYFAGGYSTLRGFAFRGASPTVATFQVGGRFRFLGSAEYQFPLTADDMFKGVLFVDYGTVEREIDIHRDNFRVAPGFGFRVAIPAMGPAPLAFDFGFPIARADTDDRQVFSFFLGFNR